MNDFKTSEKITVWMKRKGLTQQAVSDKLDITRQTFITRTKENNFKPEELLTLKTLGFEG